ncbi:MAG: hypothetical protein MI757_13515 [Pirellulales bacterium]|nr:hypothetical protein [Pirellulales bacterium]
MISRKLILRLVFAALSLPVVGVVVAATSILLRSMGDEGGSTVLGYVGLALGIVWLTSLVLLTVAVAVRALEDREPPEEPLG